MITNKLTNMSLFVDGRGYLGQAAELTPPKIVQQTMDYVAGGMPGVIKISKGLLEAMEAEFTLNGYDANILKLFNVEPCAYVPFVFRGALSDCENGTRPIVLTMRGQIQEIDMGTWKPGDDNTLKIKMNVAYYMQEIAGESIMEVDYENMIFIVNGNDQLAATRAALGI